MDTDEVVINHTFYMKTTTLNGEGPDKELVGYKWVDRYISASEFFEGLGGKEEFEQDSDGVITCTATSPDGELVRVTVFEPHEP